MGFPNTLQDGVQRNRLEQFRVHGGGEFWFEVAKPKPTQPAPSCNSATRFITPPSTKPRPRTRISNRQVFASPDRSRSNTPSSFSSRSSLSSNFDFYTPRVYESNDALYHNIQALNRSEPFLSDHEIDLVYSEVQAYFRGWNIPISHADPHKVKEQIQDNVLKKKLEKAQDNPDFIQRLILSAELWYKGLEGEVEALEAQGLQVEGRAPMLIILPRTTAHLVQILLSAS